MGAHLLAGRLPDWTMQPAGTAMLFGIAAAAYSAAGILRERK